MADYKERIGELPKDWEVVKGNSQLVLESGMRPAEHVTDNPNDIPSLGGENIDLNGYLIFDNTRYISKEYYAKMPKGKIEDGDILINKDGANTGKIAFAKSKPFDNCAVNEHVFLIRNKGEFDQEFLFYFLFSGKGNRQIQRKIVGSAQGGINNSFPKGIFIPKPPIQEQKAIATILSKVDEAIRATENSIKAAEKLKKGIMQNLLTGKLKADGTLRTDEEFYKHEKFGNCPVGWHWGRLSEIADVIAGQSPSGEYYNEDGIGTAMLNGPTEFTDLHPIPVQYTTKVTKLCAIGDILFTVRGSSTGRMNIADQEYCIGRGIAAIRAKEGCDTDFIYYTLITISEKILAEAKGAGTTFPNVSRGELLKKWVLIPDTDQTEIAAKIKSVDAFLKEKQKKVATIQRLKKSLMQNLLTGKVRVDVNKIEKLLQEQ